MSKREYCPQCQRPMKACYCHTLKNIENQLPIFIARDSQEREQAFSTALMAKLTLQKVQMFDSDEKNFKNALTSFICEEKPILIYKNQNSRPLTKEIAVQSFLILDGTWKKTNKLLFDNPEIQSLPTYHLDVETTSLLSSMRRSCSKKHLSTLEAIYYTLKIKGEDYPHLLDPLIFTKKFQSTFA